MRKKESASTSLQLHEEEVGLKTNNGELYGTFIAPDGLESFLIVLMISGSGPTDRDGNTQGLPGRNNSLKYLAEALGRHGIASIRYDKRGIGKSAFSAIKEKDLKFENYIDDAKAWVSWLKKQNKYTKLFILGHSEGSLIGMVAAQQSDIDGFISIAGTGKPASDIIIEQTKNQFTPDLVKETERIINELKNGKFVKTLPPVLNPLFRESVQPYLISWFNYDPAKEIAKLNCPILIVQGTTDIQVSIEDAKILKDANKHSKVCLIKGMNHVLKEVSKNMQKQLASYSDPSLPVSDSLITEITSFIKSLKKKRP